MPLDVELVTASGTARRRIEMAERREVARITLDAAPSAVRVDPDGWVLKDVVQRVEDAR
jgi:hypothetical protein